MCRSLSISSTSSRRFQLNTFRFFYSLFYSFFFLKTKRKCQNVVAWQWSWESRVALIRFAIVLILNWVGFFVNIYDDFERRRQNNCGKWGSKKNIFMSKKAGKTLNMQTFLEIRTQTFHLKIISQLQINFSLTTRKITDLSQNNILLLNQPFAHHSQIFFIHLRKISRVELRKNSVPPDRAATATRMNTSNLIDFASPSTHLVYKATIPALPMHLASLDRLLNLFWCRQV
jgi:hypothetical protein